MKDHVLLTLHQTVTLVDFIITPTILKNIYKHPICAFEDLKLCSTHPLELWLRILDLTIILQITI